MVSVQERIIIHGGFGDDGNMGDVWEVRWNGIAFEFLIIIKKRMKLDTNASI